MMNIALTDATAFVKKGLTVLRRKGFGYAFRYLFTYRVPLDSFWVAYYKTFKQHTFKFQGKEYAYLYHAYNRTWDGERTVEVPIVWSALQANREKRVLEVGNVLSHYFPASHHIIDKYEVADGVVNIDVVDYRPDAPYDLIVSISTLEHVGWDERVKDPSKIRRAIENLRNHLAPEGEILLTIPFGYNPHLDELVKAGWLEFNKCAYMKRVSLDNKWVEASWEEVEGSTYDEPYPHANAILVGVIRK
jgi:SAM-dependent methyltransferase